MLFPERLLFAVIALALALSVLPGSLAIAQTGNSEQNGTVIQRDAVVPAPVDEILYAREFQIESGYRPSWPPDADDVTSGLIMVFRADPVLSAPRQTPTPVLYAGNRVVEVLNTGQETGVLVGLVPDVSLEGLIDQPAWFGPPRSRTLIDEKTIQEDRSAALTAGIQTNSADDLRRVARDPLRAPDLATLLRTEIADLVLEFAPEDRALAAKWRLPELGEVRGGLQQP